jgi:hypothetical protein
MSVLSNLRFRIRALTQRNRMDHELVVDLMSDVRVALRQLRRRPLFTLLGVGTLALGVGATVALSSVVMGLLVRPLPVADEARLQVFWSDFNWRGVEFDFVKERQRAFSGLAAYSNEGYTLRVNDQSSTVLATVGSAGLFDVLAASPLMGRAFQPGDDRPGAAPITVVSHGFWQQELGGDPGVIGRRIEIDGAAVEVVGVMPLCATSTPVSPSGASPRSTPWSRRRWRSRCGCGSSCPCSARWRSSSASSASTAWCRTR